MAVFIIEVVRGVFDRHSQAFTPGWLRMCDGPTIVQLSWVLWSVCTVHSFHPRGKGAHSNFDSKKQQRVVRLERV